MNESELILNADGSIYHLNLLPGDAAETVINVGDPGRVELVSSLFDSITLVKQKREFVTHTGMLKGKRLTVMSTGIGTDNIDIVYNELDALFNIDLATRKPRMKPVPLNLIRLGTSGALHEDIRPGAHVFSRYGAGLDGLINYYPFRPSSAETEATTAFNDHLDSCGVYPRVHIIRCNPVLENMIAEGMISGITASCQGFYGPQGRTLRLVPARTGLIEKLQSFRFGECRIVNLEMETGAMYGLARMLGHACCSVNLVVANRATGAILRQAEDAMREMAGLVLDRIVTRLDKDPVTTP